MSQKAFKIDLLFATINCLDTVDTSLKSWITVLQFSKFWSLKNLEYKITTYQCTQSSVILYLKCKIQQFHY